MLELAVLSFALATCAGFACGAAFERWWKSKGNHNGR